MKAWKIRSSACSKKFCCLSWERRYRHWLHMAMMLFMCCSGERVAVKVTPRILTEETLSLPGNRGGRVLLGRRGRYKTISVVLRVLSLSLLALDHWRMWENSTSNLVGEFCGTSKVVSSAYLRITLTDERGLRSFAYMMYRQGPIPDPCTILAVIDFQ